MVRWVSRDQWVSVVLKVSKVFRDLRANKVESVPMAQRGHAVLRVNRDFRG